MRTLIQAFSKQLESIKKANYHCNLINKDWFKLVLDINIYVLNFEHRYALNVNGPGKHRIPPQKKISNQFIKFNTLYHI